MVWQSGLTSQSSLTTDSSIPMMAPARIERLSNTWRAPETRNWLRGRLSWLITFLSTRTSSVMLRIEIADRRKGGEWRQPRQRWQLGASCGRRSGYRRERACHGSSFGDSKRHATTPATTSATTTATTPATIPVTTFATLISVPSTTMPTTTPIT